MLDLHSSAHDSHGGKPLAELLAEAAKVLAHPSASQARLLEKLGDLRQRLLDGRLQLAVLGQFKRGKSTLLNALLGVDVVPTGVVPVTAIPTFFVAATGSPALRVSYLDGRNEERPVADLVALRTQLDALVTEDHNPDNVLGITRVEAAFPSDLLARGVVLIDTPGVGSTFEHNTAAAHAALADCDAALFVVSADPPITEVEVQFLARIRPAVARLVVVLNKFDLLEPSDRPTAVGFLRQVLADKVNLGSQAPVFCLSARRALRAIESGDASARRESGFEELETYLARFLATEKQAALRAAVASKATALVAGITLEVQLQLSAMHLPVEDLTRRVAAFDEAALRFETERRHVHDLLDGERRRAFETLDVEAGRLFTDAHAALLPALNEAFSRDVDAEGVQAALGEPIREFFAAALDRTSREWTDRLTVALGEHQRRLDELIGLVRRTAADLMDVPFRAPESGEAFQSRRTPFWTMRSREELLDFLPTNVLDRFLPTAVRRARQRQRLVAELEAVLRRNVENLRWAARQNLTDAFRRFASDLDEQLELSLTATRGAMAAALHQREQSAERAAEEIEALQVTLARLATVGEGLAKHQ